MAAGGRKGGGGGARQPVSRVRPGASKGAGAGAKGKAATAGSGRKGKGAVTRGSGQREGKGAGAPPRKARSPQPRKSASPKSRAPRPSAARGVRDPHRPPADPDEAYARLLATYPDAHCALDHADAYQLLVATILSAQCTDARVNMVTPALFARFPDAEALANAPQEELEAIIRSTGFFRSKAKSLLGMAQRVVEHHGGAIPDEMEPLTELPGVGRKTANVILGNAFGRNIGVVVDTHVTRLSNRLGFTTQQDPVKIEQDLMRLFPQEQWTLLSHLLIDHGRALCTARAPNCPECPLADICPSSAP